MRYARSIVRAMPTAEPIVVWRETVEAAFLRASRSDCVRLLLRVSMIAFLAYGSCSDCTYSCCMCFSARPLRSGPSPFLNRASESEDMAVPWYTVLFLFLTSPSGHRMCSGVGLLLLVRRRSGPRSSRDCQLLGSRKKNQQPRRTRNACR